MRDSWKQVSTGRKPGERRSRGDLHEREIWRPFQYSKPLQTARSLRKALADAGHIVDHSAGASVAKQQLEMQHMQGQSHR